MGNQRARRGQRLGEVRVDHVVGCSGPPARVSHPGIPQLALLDIVKLEVLELICGLAGCLARVHVDNAATSASRHVVRPRVPTARSLVSAARRSCWWAKQPALGDVARPSSRHLRVVPDRQPGRRWTPRTRLTRNAGKTGGRSGDGGGGTRRSRLQRLAAANAQDWGSGTGVGTRCWACHPAST